MNTQIGNLSLISYYNMLFKKFPKLIKKNGDNFSLWEISLDNTKEYPFIIIKTTNNDGKIKETTQFFKNDSFNKSNIINLYDQANITAKTLWEKQIKNGYKYY